MRLSFLWKALFLGSTVVHALDLAGTSCELDKHEAEIRGFDENQRHGIFVFVLDCAPGVGLYEKWINPFEVWLNPRQGILSCCTRIPCAHPFEKSLCTTRNPLKLGRMVSNTPSNRYCPGNGEEVQCFVYFQDEPLLPPHSKGEPNSGDQGNNQGGPMVQEVAAAVDGLEQVTDLAESNFPTNNMYLTDTIPQGADPNIPGNSDPFHGLDANLLNGRKAKKRRSW